MSTITKPRTKQSQAVLLAMLLSLCSLLSGCFFASGPDLKPTVKSLRKTIKAMREDDYEKGRVIYSSKANINSQLLAAKIERLKEAENDAAVALGEEKPHKLGADAKKPEEKEVKDK